MLLSIQLGVCCTNPSGKLSGEIPTHLVPQLGLEDEIFLHTIIFSAYLILELQQTVGRIIGEFPARMHHTIEEGSI